MNIHLPDCLCKLAVSYVHDIFNTVCRRGNTSTVKFLVSKGVPIDVYNIQIATIYGHISVVKFLASIISKTGPLRWQSLQSMYMSGIISGINIDKMSKLLLLYWNFDDKKYTNIFSFYEGLSYCIYICYCPGNKKFFVKFGGGNIWERNIDDKYWFNFDPLHPCYEKYMLSFQDALILINNLANTKIDWLKNNELDIDEISKLKEIYFFYAKQVLGSGQYHVNLPLP